MVLEGEEETAVGEDEAGTPGVEAEGARGMGREEAEMLDAEEVTLWEDREEEEGGEEIGATSAEAEARREEEEGEATKEEEEEGSLEEGEEGRGGWRDVEEEAAAVALEASKGVAGEGLGVEGRRGLRREKRDLGRRSAWVSNQSWRAA